MISLSPQGTRAQRKSLSPSLFPQVEAAFKRVLRDVSEMFDSGLKLWKSGAAPSASITGCAPPEFRRDYYASVGATKPKPLQ